VNIDFRFCERVNCKHLSRPVRALGFTLEAHCGVVVDFNAQHVYTDKDGEFREDKGEMIPWEDVPKGCPFKLEMMMAMVDNQAESR
jgi:hypothetical protein